MKFNEYLKSINACNEAIKWAGEKTWQEVFESCHRGDWLLWLYKVTNQGDLRQFTLAKAHCANTVRHLMKDKRSIDAVDIAIKFGHGNATKEKLAAAYADADYAAADYAAAYTAAAAAAAADYAAAYTAAAAAAAAAAADAATDAAYAAAAAAAAAADAATDAAYAAAAARKENQQLTADICRKYLPFKIWNINL